MGQKVHPIGFRLGGIQDWQSKWFATKNYARDLHEDLKIREHIFKELAYAGISKVIIERFGQKIKVNIHTARPGVVIGKSGVEVERLRKSLQNLTSQEIHIDIHEIRQPEIDAQLVAENVALQLKKRVSFRRAMKQAVATAMRFGAEGIKIACAGRLAGAEIARTEWYREGRVPLHTIRGDIDYGFAEATTTYGQIGIKVWIYKGEVLSGSKKPTVVLKEPIETERALQEDEGEKRDKEQVEREKPIKKKSLEDEIKEDLSDERFLKEMPERKRRRKRRLKRAIQMKEQEGIGEIDYYVDAKAGEIS